MKKIPVIFFFFFLFLFLSGCTGKPPSPVVTNDSLKTYDSPSYGISFEYPGEWTVTANETILETQDYHPLRILRLKTDDTLSGFFFTVVANYHRLPPQERYADSDNCGGGWTDERDNLTVLEAYNETTIGKGVHARRFIFRIDDPKGETIETIYEICRSYKSGTNTHYWIFWSVPSDTYFDTRPQVQKVLDSVRVTEPILSNTTSLADVQTTTLTQPVGCNPQSCLPPSGIYRPQPPFEGDTPLFSPDINEVVSYLGPDLKIPAWLPEGYVFSTGGLWNPENDGRNVLEYESNHGNIFIIYSYYSDWNYRSFLPGEPKAVCMNGTEYMIFSTNTSRQVRWCDGKIIRWITGPGSEEEILRIAESLSPPDAVDLSPEIYVTNDITISTPVPQGPLGSMTFPATPKGTV